MQRNSRKQNGRSYIIQSIVVIGAYVALSVLVTVRVFSAMQLSLFTKLLLMGSLWATIVCFVIVLRRYYLRLPNE